MGIGAGRFSTSPSAIVPSWQLRHSFDALVGCPGEASRVELQYSV
jgi:hypothetical protein